jgi:hypothetical protein
LPPGDIRQRRFRGANQASGHAGVLLLRHGASIVEAMRKRWGEGRSAAADQWRGPPRAPKTCERREKAGETHQEAPAESSEALEQT